MKKIGGSSKGKSVQSKSSSKSTGGKKHRDTGPKVRSRGGPQHTDSVTSDYVPPEYHMRNPEMKMAVVVPSMVPSPKASRQVPLDKQMMKKKF